MKIFTAEQIKKWDAFTIAHEPITSVNLMERAAGACFKWLLGKNFGLHHFRIFCGKGNNGGDGLALARLLTGHGCRASVYILELGNIGSPDFQTNLERLRSCSSDIHFIRSAEFFPEIGETDMVVDALFGTGLHSPPEGISRELVEHINRCKAPIVSIDMPSGLYADKTSKGNMVVRATITLSFQNHKLAFLLPENEACCGEVHLLHIGLHKDFEATEPAAFEFADHAFIHPLYKPRAVFTHKGTCGHAALICGSYGMMGAAVLSARGCLRSGVGKLTSFVPACGYDIMQISVPEAMCIAGGEKYLSGSPDIENYDATGIGPGMGMHPTYATLLKDFFQKTNKPVVIDADALNVMAANKSLLPFIPASSILTPHPKEFERLFGKTADDFERLQRALQKSEEHNIYILLKGHYSFLSTPQRKGYFNSSGNPGMATAGSGDVLTGILTGLLAQGYTPADAALLGMYLHGLAGDIAVQKMSPEAMLASDITEHLGEAFRMIASQE